MVVVVVLEATVIVYCQIDVLVYTMLVFLYKQIKDTFWVPETLEMYLIRLYIMVQYLYGNYSQSTVYRVQTLSTN